MTACDPDRIRFGGKLHRGSLCLTSWIGITGRWLILNNKYFAYLNEWDRPKYLLYLEVCISLKKRVMAGPVTAYTCNSSS